MITNISPKFDSEFLEGLAIAFRKRLKALKHKASEVNYAKVYERHDDVIVERLEVHIEHGRLVSGVLFRLNAWPNRQIWVDARKPLRRGLEWNWTTSGRLLSERGGRDVVNAIEAQLALFSQVDEANKAVLDAPWKKLLGRKPVELR